MSSCIIENDNSLGFFLVPRVERNPLKSNTTLATTFVATWKVEVQIALGIAFEFSAVKEFSILCGRLAASLPNAARPILGYCRFRIYP